MTSVLSETGSLFDVRVFLDGFLAGRGEEECLGGPIVLLLIGGRGDEVFVG